MFTIRIYLSFVSLAAFGAGMFLSFGLPVTYAAEFTVFPRIVDMKGRVRDTVKVPIMLTNTTAGGITVMGWVDDITKEGGQVAVSDNYAQIDKTTSFAQWIEFPRTIDIAAHEKKEIMLVATINPGALSGIYHATLSFGSGDSENEAKRRIEATVFVTMEVLDTTLEQLRVKDLAPQRTIFFSNPMAISYVINNTGGRALVPEGKLRLYNRLGEEVEAIEVNTEGKAVMASSSEVFSHVWNMAVLSSGKYKAVLDLEYGTKERYRLGDIVFFWVLPKYLFGIALGILCSLLFFMMVWYRRLHNNNEDD